MNSKMLPNIKRTFILIVTLFVISTFSQRSGVNNDMFKPFFPLKATPRPVTRSFELDLTRERISPDGFETEAFTINSLYPGSIIHVNKGDTIRARVNNHLGDGTSIHWHGMFQLGTTWFDGVVGQTQCPIASGDSLVYEFSTGDQAGTFWYHAHTHGQYMEGVLAPLIIHDPNDPYRKDYNEEFVITLSEWYHDKIADLLSKRMAPNYAGLNPIPDAGLISGVGRFNCSAAPRNSKCRKNNPLAVYKFVPGKTYRLRVINTSGYAHFIFSIDQHKLTVIEAEGQYTKPVTVDRLPMHIAQRYSVLVKANKKVGNYWMRATIDKRCVPIVPGTINEKSAINYNVLGIVRYEGADNSDPDSKDFPGSPLPPAAKACLTLDHNLLKPLKRETFGRITDKIEINITFGDDDKNITRAFINNSSYVPDTFDPTVKKIVTDDLSVGDLRRSENAIGLVHPDGYADITMFNRNGAVHPFHIHGHIFHVMGTGSGFKVDKNKFFKVPFPRDTFTLSPNSWTVFRVKTDNPGIWSLHCHIEWHVEMGMIVQFVELPQILTKRTIPDSVNRLCKNRKKDVSKLPGTLPRRKHRRRDIE